MSLPLPNKNWSNNNTILFFVLLGIFVAIIEFDILNFELEKFDAAVLAKRNKQQEGKAGPQVRRKTDSRSSSATITEIPELKKALDDGLITADGTLNKPRSEFVLYCQNNNLFSSRNKKSGWASIDNLLKDMKTGKPIKASQFSQSYQDLARDGKVPLD